MTPRRNRSGGHGCVCGPRALNHRGPDPQNVNQQQTRPLSGKASPTTAKLHKVHDLGEISTIRKGVSPRPAKEEPTIHDWAEKPGVWGPAEI